MFVIHKFRRLEHLSGLEHISGPPMGLSGAALKNRLRQSVLQMERAGLI